MHFSRVFQSFPNKDEYQHKENAIKECSHILSDALPNELKDCAYVPVPPSKIQADPNYDDRLIQILDRISGIQDIRNFVEQTESHEAFRYRTRMKPQELSEYYRVNKDDKLPVPSKIVIFDDLLVTGCHYNAVKIKIQELYPQTSIVGLFIARTISHSMN